MSPNSSGGVWFAVAEFFAKVAYAAVIILPGSEVAYAGHRLPAQLPGAAGLLLIIGD